MSSMQTQGFRVVGQHDAIEFIDKLIDQLNMDAVVYFTNPDVIETALRITLSESENYFAQTVIRNFARCGHSHYL